MICERRRSTTSVSADRQEAYAAELYALETGHPVGDLVNLSDLAFRHDYFEAVLMVQMHVDGANSYLLRKTVFSDLP